MPCLPGTRSTGSNIPVSAAVSSGSRATPHPMPGRAIAPQYIETRQECAGGSEKPQEHVQTGKDDGPALVRRGRLKRFCHKCFLFHPLDQAWIGEAADQARELRMVI